MFGAIMAILVVTVICILPGIIAGALSLVYYYFLAKIISKVVIKSAKEIKND